MSVLKVRTTKRTSFVNITHMVKEEVKKSGVNPVFV